MFCRGWPHSLDIRTDPPSHRDYLVLSHWWGIIAIIPANCRSLPPTHSSRAVVAAVVLLDVFARLMLCPPWLPRLGTESSAGASFSIMQGSPISQYANWIKCRQFRSLDILTKRRKAEKSKRLKRDICQLYGECPGVLPVLYAQVCRVITGYFATVATTQPSLLTTPLTAPWETKLDQPFRIMWGFYAFISILKWELDICKP